MLLLLKVLRVILAHIQLLIDKFIIIISDEYEYLLTRYTPQSSSPSNCYADQQQLLTCDCGQVFKKQMYYNFHMKWECGRRQLCARCNKSFKHKSTLSKHVKICRQQHYR